MSSLTREEIDQRIREMDANNRIEGVEPNPEYRAYTNNLRNLGFSEKEILSKFIDKVKK